MSSSSEDSSTGALFSPPKVKRKASHTSLPTLTVLGDEDVERNRVECRTEFARKNPDEDHIKKILKVSGPRGYFMPDTDVHVCQVSILMTKNEVLACMQWWQNAQ